VKDEVHTAESGDAINQLNTTKLLCVEKGELFFVELVVVTNELVCEEQETTGAAGRIANRLVRLRLHYIDKRADERTRSEVLL
jgi:hypothetical protein